MIRHATFVLTEQDLIHAARHHIRNTTFRPQQLLWIVVLWLLAIFLLIDFDLAQLASWRSLRANAPIFVAAAVLAPAIVLVGSILYAFVLAPGAIRRQFQQQKNLSEPAQISWTDDVYEVRTDTAQSRTPWVDHARSSETGQLFLFYISEGLYQILPKRALTDVQIADLRAILDRVK